MTTLSVQKSEVRQPYTAMPQEIIDSKLISGEAKLMMQILLSRPPGWKIHVKDLQNRTGWGRDKVYRVLKELREVGYVQHVWTRRLGEFSANHYMAFESLAEAQTWAESNPAQVWENGTTVAKPALAEAVKAAKAGSAAEPVAGQPDTVSWFPGNGGTSAKTKDLFDGDQPEADAQATPASTVSWSAGYGKPAHLVSTNNQPDANASLSLSDARAREGDTTTKPKAVTKAKAAKPVRPSLSAEAIAIYNEVAVAKRLPKCIGLTGERPGKLNVALAELGGIDGWRALCEKLRASRFCAGENNNGWKASFDFLLQPKSRTKLMEDAYSDENCGVLHRERVETEKRERIAAARAAEAARVERAKSAQAAEAARAERGASASTGVTASGALKVAPTLAEVAAAHGVEPTKLEELWTNLRRQCGDRIDVHRRTIQDLSIPAQWLAAGCEWFDIREAVGATLAGGKGGKIYSWQLFSDAVIAKHAVRMQRRKEYGTKFVAEGAAVWNEDGSYRMLPEKYTFSDWDGIFASIYDPMRKVDGFKWHDNLGPLPGEVDCLAPPVIQERYGFKPTPDCIPRWAERMEQLHRVAAEEQAENERLMAALDAKRAKVVADAAKRGKVITGNVGMTLSLKALSVPSPGCS